MRQQNNSFWRPQELWRFEAVTKHEQLGQEDFTEGTVRLKTTENYCAHPTWKNTGIHNECI